MFSVCRVEVLVVLLRMIKLDLRISDVSFGHMKRIQSSCLRTFNSFGGVVENAGMGLYGSNMSTDFRGQVFHCRYLMRGLLTRLTISESRFFAVSGSIFLDAGSMIFFA